MIRKHYSFFAYQITGLKDLCKKDGKPEVDHIRRAVDEYLKRHKAQTFISSAVTSPSGKEVKNA